uniref:Bromo domain-containing protein n=1 Tax=Kalmanozyma brasiliensis (strain GHG001) TaxID=1365824 RepID=V5EQ49_KALBG
MSRRAGIESANIVDGPRKRLRGNNDASADDASAAAPSASTSTASTAGMGAIERRIHSLSHRQVAQQGQRLMDTVMEAIDPTDGAPLHEYFLELPDANDYPDYFDLIKRPMALDQIQAKLDDTTPTGRYATLPDIKHDFETICNNAKRYNQRDTPVWLKARDLHSLVKITYVQIVETLPEPEPNPPDMTPAATGAEGAPSGAEASTPARSKRITLRTSKSTQKLNDQVQPKAEVQDQPIPPMPTTSKAPSDSRDAVSNAPFTPSRQQSQQPYTAAGTPSSAADDDDADADGDDDEDGDSSKLTKGGLFDGRKRPGKRGKRLKATLRQLVYDLRRVIGTRGYPIVQHFETLPDRRENPQYYQVISKPISLREIDNRVFEKVYINAHALFVDLELMLNNAMSFYPPDSPVWQDAAEIRQYFEREAIPALMQDGFTLEKDDKRQSALPLHLAANSTIEAHKNAYKMLISKTGGEGASQSPEPSSQSRLGSVGLAGSPAMAAHGLPAGSSAVFGSPSPAAQATSTPNAHAPMMMGTPGSMPMSMPMPPPASMSPMPGMPPGMGMAGSPGRPMQFPGTTMTPSASPRPVATPEGRRPVGRPPGKGTPSRSNPYPFLERRVGPGRPKKHEAAARQAAIAAHEEMLRKQALHDQQENMTQQQQAAAFAAQPIPHPSPMHQMLPPGTPGAVHSPFGSGMPVGEPPSPVKRKEVVLPAEPKEPIAIEGIEHRVPLVANFAIGMEVEEPDGQTLAVPPLEIKNGAATQHTLQIPPNASSITIEFPLRMLNKKQKPKVAKSEVVEGAPADGDVSMEDAAPAKANGDGRESSAKPTDAAVNGISDADSDSLTWPWQPELSFNGKHTHASWTAADSFIDPALLGDEDDEEIATSIGYSYCKVRLLPKRGINVFEITVKPDPSYPPISQVPAERYAIYFC